MDRYKILRDIGITLLTNANESASLLKQAAKAAHDLIKAQEAYALMLDENGRFQLVYSNAPTPKSIEALRTEIARHDGCTTSCFSTKGHVCVRLSENYLIYLIGDEWSPKQNEMLDLFREQTALQLRGIVQHEKTAADLRNSKDNRYHNLLSSLYEGVSEVDAEANTTYVNEQMAKMLGYTIEQMLGKHLYSFMDEEGGGIANTNLSRHEQGIEEQYPFKFLNKDGQPIYTLMETSRYVGTIARVMDVIERERALEEIRDSEKRFDDLVETTSDWIWEVDANGIYTYSNNVIADLLGYAPGEIIGTTPFDLMVPEEAGRVGKVFADIMAKKEPFIDLWTVHKHKNGELIPISTTGVPILGANEELLGYRGIDRNITVLAKQKETRAKARRQAQLLLSAIGGIGESLNFQTMLEVGLCLINNYANWVYSEAWIVDTHTGRLVNHAQFCPAEYQDRLSKFSALSSEMTFAPEEGIPGLTWVSQKTAWYENIQNLPAGMYLRHDAANEVGLKTVLAVPALVNKKTTAVLMFYTDSVYEKESEVMQLATAVANQIGLIRQQKQTQETVRKLSHAVEQSATSIFITDLDGSIEFVNPAFIKISGYSESEIFGKNPSLFRGKNTPESIHKALWAALKEGGTWEGRIENRREDGTLIWLQSNVSTIKDSHGNPTHYLCIQRDITEQMAAETALRNSEAHNRALIQAIPDMMFLLDGEGVFLDYYGAEEGQWLPREAFLNKNMKDVMPSHVYEPSFAAIGAAIRTGETQQFSYGLSTDDDLSSNYYDARIVVVKDNLLLTIVRDVTAQRQYGTVLRESKRKLAKAQELSHVGSWEREIESGKISWSDETYRIFGHQTQSFEPTYAKFLDMVHPEDVEELKTALQHCLDTHEPHHSKHRIKRPSGEIRYVQEKGEVICNENGDVLRMIGAVLDITEQTIANQKLERAYKVAQELKIEAERSNRAKSIFLTNMSHELRTPLNGILGYTQLFKRDDSLSTQQLHGIDVIHRSGEHLLSMINDILDLAKVEAGKMTLNVNKCHLPDMLTTLVSLVNQLAQQKGITFSHRLGVGMPQIVMTDGVRLQQVLLNLLGNAVKFTDSGSILLEVFPVQTAVSPSNSSTTKIRFRIEDTGIGIAPELLESIFSPFEQVSTAKGSIIGTGLGLTISQRLVSLLGGTLKVSSGGLGKGTVFWFDLELPVVRSNAGDAENANLASAPINGVQGNENLRLLIVDDVESDRLVFRNYFSTLSGFDIMDAHDGESAVAEAKTFKPHLVLMDLSMPTMDGVEAARQIRQLPALENISIIAVSANAYVNSKEEPLASWFDDFLVKPIKLTQLLEKIRELFDDEWKWLYAEEQTEAIMVETAVIIPLPEEETAVLLELARDGDIENLRNALSRFKQRLGPEYAPLIEQLTQLARLYHVRQIRELLEKQT